MITQKNIQQRYLCRRCLSQALGTELSPDEITVIGYPQKCLGCGNIKNLVINIRLTKRLFLRDPGDKRES